MSHAPNAPDSHCHHFFADIPDDVRLVAPMSHTPRWETSSISLRPTHSTYCKKSRASTTGVGALRRASAELRMHSCWACLVLLCVALERVLRRTSYRTVLQRVLISMGWNRRLGYELRVEIFTTYVGWPVIGGPLGEHAALCTRICSLLTLLFEV